MIKLEVVFIFRNGYYNELDFVRKLNNRYVGDLEQEFVNLIYKIYNYNVKENDLIRCYKSFKTDKTDIVVVINGVKKNVSIKSGKNNSIHLESLEEFIGFLKNNGVTDDVINLYFDYHNGLNENGYRISVKEYQIEHVEEINKINLFINDKKILNNAIERFLFKGTNYCNNRVDFIIYGNVNKFFCYSREEIRSFLLQYNEQFNSIHFSCLILQPWARNLNFNEKYEYRRGYVQVKWYRLDMMESNILCNK